MTKEEILEGNKLIAEFLGYVYVPYTVGHSGGNPGWVLKNYKLIDRKTPKLFLGRTTKDLLYHTSWDWLMPVVEKIEKTTAFVNIKGCLVNISTIVEVSAPTKLEAVWLAVVEFIEWYNTQNK